MTKRRGASSENGFIIKKNEIENRKTTSNEVIWPKKVKFHAWVKKCHFG
jgi:hypothetical protein